METNGLVRYFPTSSETRLTNHSLIILKKRNKSHTEMRSETRLGFGPHDNLFSLSFSLTSFNRTFVILEMCSTKINPLNHLQIYNTDPLGTQYTVNQILKEPGFICNILGESQKCCLQSHACEVIVGLLRKLSKAVRKSPPIRMGSVSCCPIRPIE